MLDKEADKEREIEAKLLEEEQARRKMMSIGKSILNSKGGRDSTDEIDKSGHQVAAEVVEAAKESEIINVLQESEKISDLPRNEDIILNTILIENL